MHFWPGSGRGPITSIQSIRQSEHPSNKPAKVDSETTAGSVAGKRFTSFWSKSCSCWPIVGVAWFTGGRFWEVHRGQEDFGGRWLLWHPAFWANAFYFWFLLFRGLLYNQGFGETCLTVLWGSLPHTGCSANCFAKAGLTLAVLHTVLQKLALYWLFCTLF